ncbi:hypothetical protein [Kribbella sp. CA-293567]|uniref:hypothetical protein n=1 Tax=Kribbella sp. CA-293567 TaxID=3002436 RepID=UPI0022DD24A2|nr:hypothetical protein [Kribbella sp. CA-293567]WBQ08407.1 hypothetical protein OX958_16700 [Kribbella sp. CA-293567]
MSTTTSAATKGPEYSSKAIVSQWETAWTEKQPAKMAALFTRDAVYTDLAFGAEWHGRTEIAGWQPRRPPQAVRPPVNWPAAN